MARLLLGPALVALAIGLPKIWQGDFNVDTGWYAAIALQAYRGIATEGLRAWWSLQGGADGVPYFNKPPLAFWLNGLPLAIFGPTIWAARLGSLIAAVLCVVMTSLLVRRASGLAAGRTAGLVLATSIPFIGLGRSFSLDLWLAFFAVLAISAITQTRYRSTTRPIAAAGVALGLALLIKPFVGLMALLAVIVWCVSVGPKRKLMWVVPVLAIAGLIAAVWHVWMIRSYGDRFLGQYFGREIVERAAGNRGSATFNLGAESPLYYLRVLAESYWPWAITVLLAVASLVRMAKAGSGIVGSQRRTDRDWLWFGLIWTVVWLVSLSMFADKRPRYLAPLFPVWAWMSALWLTRAWGGGPAVRRVWRRVSRGLPFAACTIAVIVSVVPIRLHKPQDANWTKVLAWIDAHPRAPIYQGGFVGQRMAKIYLHTGKWPAPTDGTAGGERKEPPAGAYLLYHTRDGLAPGPNEEIVLAADKLVITRLGSGGWAPIVTPDPGE
jgi:4-amino-4-deoxy-L-arabinose transferase-like glycosyltransferase